MIDFNIIFLKKSQKKQERAQYDEKKKQKSLGLQLHGCTQSNEPYIN